MGEHQCPRCGRLTEGSTSDDGTYWPICKDCMDAERKARAGLADELQRGRLEREKHPQPPLRISR
jgi:hypothetical protein